MSSSHVRKSYVFLVVIVGLVLLILLLGVVGNHSLGVTGNAFRQVQDGYEITSFLPLTDGTLLPYVSICPNQDDCAIFAECVRFGEEVIMGREQSAVCSINNNFIRGVAKRSVRASQGGNTPLGNAFTALCPRANMCPTRAQNCVEVGTTDATGIASQIYKCEGVSADWVLYYQTASYLPGENRARPSVHRADCPQQNRCVAADGTCHSHYADYAGLRCGPDHNWAYWITTSIPRAGQQPLHVSGLCQQQISCVNANNECIAVGQNWNNLRCTADGTWQPVISSYVPGEDRTRPAVRQGICPGTEMCIKSDRTCVAQGSTSGTGANTLTCGSDHNWGYAISSTKPDGNINRGVCQQRNACVRANGQCVAVGTVVGDYTCGLDKNWGYAITSSKPDGSTNQGVCQRRDQCITSSSRCMDVGQSAGNGLTCGPSNRWGYAITSSKPDGSTNQGVCQRRDQCITSSSRCMDVGQSAGNGLTCGPSNRWGYAIQSYIPNEDRSHPAARQGVCQKLDQCIGIDGRCYDTGIVRENTACFEKNWLGCGDKNTRQQEEYVRGDPTLQLGHYDIIGNYLCKDRRFVPIDFSSCTNEHPIITDIFIDTQFVTVSDDTIQEMVRRNNLYLCAKTPGMNYAYQLRNVIRLNSGQEPTPESIKQYYTSHRLSYPEFVRWFGFIEPPFPHGGYYNIVETNSPNYCNRYIPVRKTTSKSAFVYNVNKVNHFTPDQDLTSYFIRGEDAGNGLGGYMNGFLNHEFLHGYASGHVGGRDCNNAIADPRYQGRLIPASVCPNGIANLIDATHSCRRDAQGRFVTPQLSIITPPLPSDQDRTDVDRDHTKFLTDPLTIANNNVEIVNRPVRTAPIIR
ncbi:hypothetical protein HYV86_06645 [Candidatus Woesearchaeota archaeon]|nr:hypothetical protein [Candidatus Woesearchaeota archaeon]